MGKRYLIDSNILIDFTARKLPDQVYKSIESIIDQEFIISFVTKIEVLGYSHADEGWKMFIDQAQLLVLDDLVINETIQIRKKHKIKLPDAIIAATASINHLILITRNTGDFSNIKGLSAENPWLWNPTQTPHS